MRLGLFLVLFGDLSIAEALDRAVAAGVDDVEIGTGNYPGAAHCDPAALLADANGLAAFRHAIDSRCLTVSALACHGNPLHPRSDVARAHHETFIRTVELAQRLGVDTVTSSRAAPATPRRRRTRTGSRAPGRQSTGSSSNGSGARR